MAYPVMAGSIATTLINITDSAFLGRIGEVELGAAAIGGILYFVFVMIGMAVGTGSQILIARRSGEKNDSAIGAIFDQSMLLMLLLSILIFLLLNIILPGFLPDLIRDKQVAEAVTKFLKYRAYGIFFIMSATVFRSFFVGIAQPRIFAYYSALMAALNIFFCFVFIYGKFGVASMSIAGAGLASSLSEALGLVFLLIYTSTRKNIGTYRLFRFDSLSQSMNNKIISLSAPLVVQNLLSMLGWFFFFLFIEKSGKHQLAISNAVRGVYMIAMTPIWGYSVAANSMISNLIGQSRSDEVIKFLNRILVLAFVTSFLSSVVAFLLRTQLLQIFTDDALLIRDSIGSLNVVLLSMYVFSISIVMVSAVSGTGATQVALRIELVAIFIYMIYIYATTLKYHCSIEVVWMSEFVYWLIIFAASYYYLKGLKWQKIKV